MILYLKNLPYHTTADELKALFQQYGVVTRVRVPLERDTGRPRGFAFVEMLTVTGGQKAIKEMNGYSLGGRELSVIQSRDF